MSKNGGIVAGLLVVLACCACLPPAFSANAPTIVSVQKIWDQGRHNAFTDLIRWHDAWYCVFREADAHVGGNGQIRVLKSADGDTWKSVALVGEEGVDLRDPKLSIAPDDRLMLLLGGSVYEGKKLIERQPRVAFSRDGRDWTSPVRLLSKGEWLWRVTWHAGRAYGASYRDCGNKPWILTLLSSNDGRHYEPITRLNVPGRPNETTLRFLPNGDMVALVRREGKDRNASIGVSQSPYRDWKWHETGRFVGGPNFIVLPDGDMWAAGRDMLPGGAKTVLARFGTDKYEPILTLPSGGDTSYPGLVCHDDLLWMSYYSSHEGKTSVYLAKIKVK